MLSAIKKLLFGKSSYEPEVSNPNDEEATFLLKIKDLTIGILVWKDGVWTFQYSDEFKQDSQGYRPIIGFSKVDKVYKSEELWPFFKIRIPGLRQPAVREKLERENIDAGNEVALLRRFGERSISNPYFLFPQ